MLNIVMITLGRERLLKQALESLVANTYSPLSLVLINDGGDRDKLPDVNLSSHKIWASMVVSNPKPTGVGAAKNQGVELARGMRRDGSLLYLSDNDVWFSPGWDKTLVGVLSVTKAGVVGGWNHPYLQPLPEVRPSAIVRYRAEKSIYSVLRHDAVSGPSWLMRWETWDKYGPLDENPGVRQSEDWAFCQKIRKDGGECVSVWPPVVESTGITDTFGNLVPGHAILSQHKIEGVYYE